VKRSFSITVLALDDCYFFIFINAGLFNYPLLMAADILIYRSNVVPVGQDQVQHIEMTRDIAGYFNQTWKKVFPLPEARLDRQLIVPGTDGKKMSKSYGNTIDIFAEGPALKSAVMKIVTDSTPVEAPKDPQTDNVFALYALLATAEERDALAGRYRAGGLGYGDAKKLLIEKIDERFRSARQRRSELERDPGLVEASLRRGAERARGEARETMRQVREAVGEAEIFAVARGVLADQVDLADALGEHASGFDDNRFETAAAKVAAKLRDHAERAGMIAALGDFNVSVVARGGKHARREVVTEIGLEGVCLGGGSFA